MRRGEIITQAMLTDRDLTDQEAALLQSARRNAGKIRGMGDWMLLDLFAAIGDLMEREPGRRQRDDNEN